MVMKKPVQVLLLLLALLAGLGTTSLVILHTHAASTSCSNPDFTGLCGGESPLTSGCYRDGTTLTTATINDQATKQELGYAQIRFSAACRTAWGRVVSVQGIVFRLFAAIWSGTIFSPGSVMGQAINGVGSVNNDANVMFSAMVPVPAGTSTLFVQAQIQLKRTVAGPSTIIKATIH